MAMSAHCAPKLVVIKHIKKYWQLCSGYLFQLNYESESLLIKIDQSLNNNESKVSTN